jgi:hypothetical protein
MPNGKSEKGKALSKGAKMKPAMTLKKELVSKSSDGSTKTKYPEKISSSGVKSQLTKITKPYKAKRGM